MFSFFPLSGADPNRRPYAVSQVIDALRSLDDVAREVGCEVSHLEDWVAEELQFCRQVMDMTRQPLHSAVSRSPPSDIAAFKEHVLQVIYGFLLVGEMKDPTTTYFLPLACDLIALEHLEHLISDTKAHAELLKVRHLFGHMTSILPSKEAPRRDSTALPPEMFYDFMSCLTSNITFSGIGRASHIMIVVIYSMFGLLEKDLKPVINPDRSLARLRRRLVNRVGRLAMPPSQGESGQHLLDFNGILDPDKDKDSEASTTIAYDQEWIFSNYVRLCVLLLPLGFSLALVLRASYVKHAEFVEENPEVDPSSLVPQACAEWARFSTRALAHSRPVSRTYLITICTYERAVNYIMPYILLDASSHLDDPLTTETYGDMWGGVVTIIQKSITQMMMGGRLADAKALELYIGAFQQMCTHLSQLILADATTRVVTRGRIMKTMAVYTAPPSITLDYWKERDPTFSPAGEGDEGGAVEVTDLRQAFADVFEDL